MNEAGFFKKYNAYKVRRFKRKARRISPGKILFLGDSITELLPLRTELKAYPTFNSGISGNTTADLLARMDICVYPYRPGAVVILAGINDIINDKKDASHIIENYRKILQGLQSNGIRKIIVQSCYPTCGEFSHANKEIRRLNLLLEQLAAEFDCLYLDMYTPLEDPHSGGLAAVFTKDGLHPNKKGYRVVTELLKAALPVVLASGDRHQEER